MHVNALLNLLGARTGTLVVPHDGRAIYTQYTILNINKSTYTIADYIYLFYLFFLKGRSWTRPTHMTHLNFLNMCNETEIFGDCLGNKPRVGENSSPGV